MRRKTMEKLNEYRKRIRMPEALRWLLIAVGAALAAFLGATLEIPRVHAQAGAGFFFAGAKVRVITPNGDGKNDRAILCLDNPQFNAVRARVYDLRGHLVSNMEHIPNGATMGCPSPGGPAPNPEALRWDGRSNGSFVASGVYIYQVQAEGSTVTGTFVVAR